ncbi:MAG: DUF2620 domain-containing protein [Erysipelotrichaceae bacterium]|nr:DUF2620 domain-containing protein [Erysipelotrichaceae bacterium]
MIRIVVGGQIDKQEIAKDILNLAKDKVSVDIKSDLDAAMAMKNNQYDYYIGACNTGGGGALAMAIALLGNDLCSTVSMPGNIKDESFIKSEFEKGKKAFGFTAQHREKVLPTIINEILNK